MNRLSISHRITLGFALLTLMVLMMGVVAYYSVNALGGGYERYRNKTGQMSFIQALAADLSKARLVESQYRVSPTDEKAAIVADRIATLIADINIARDNNADDAAIQTFLTDMTALTDSYASSFQNLVSQDKDLNIKIDALEAAVAEAMQELRTVLDGTAQGGNTEVTNLTAKAQERLLLAEIYAEKLTFTDNPEYAALMKENIQQSVAHLADVKARLADGNAASRPTAIEGVVETAIGMVAAIEDRLDAISSSVAERVALKDGILRTIGPDIQSRLDDWAQNVVNRQGVLGAQGQQLVDRASIMTPVLSGVILLVSLLTALFITRWVTSPLRRLTQTTGELANGNTDVQIDGTSENHEIGKMAQALEVFRVAQIERDKGVAEREKHRDEQAKVFAAISQGLKALAAGQLDARINENVSAEYQALCDDFNNALAQLERTMAGVIEAALTIEASANGVSNASTDLSRRTENQAATLEQTAAALDQLTASVRSSADRAAEVASTVDATRTEAKGSGAVVGEAVKAMGQIEASSQQISQITEVISDISFQTNLLALNAGVEAARAGDAGRGFAVVASEVRALAQRSSQAASEVSDLISTSSTHVREGTKLVNSAGEALVAFVDKVDQISQFISEIASHTAEQASGISEINVGVNELDKVTQQNAAMVESSNQQGQALVHEAAQLDKLVKAFKLTAGIVQSPQNVTMASTAKPLDARMLANDLAEDQADAPATFSTARRSGTAQVVAFDDAKRPPEAPAPKAKAVGDSNIWEDF
ncbi:methyl-accepting chemotaxis protein [Yoonia sp. SS1-5]|uniref:Methyl-accepting chemotaxis protein n=1 Tax=Yoonia rhodophyticola TaxID=3137370 RepID=A0AAN0MBE9_9RHOB